MNLGGFALESVNPREVGADDFRDVDPDLGTLATMNTPEEYRAALRRAGFADDGSG